MDETKSDLTMGTALGKIADLSEQDSRAEFRWLMPHITQANLIGCFNELDGKKAVGIDGKTKAMYAENLGENIQQLHERMKRFTYRPMPVREVVIPKGGGKVRTLGISTIEDKLIQMMFAKILEAIYEPLFCQSSYGFRPGRSAHEAIGDALDYLKRQRVEHVIDVDLENYFDTIRHTDIMKMLSHKIKDKTFLRYISRLLRAGRETLEGPKRGEAGLAQGSILSPILSNIYAHYVIDLWMEKVVPKHTVGDVKSFRFCDDIIVCCTDSRDQEKLTRSLEKRLAKFGLKLNLEKTRQVKFSRLGHGRGEKQGSFDFLGFTLYLSRTLKGNFVTTKVKTSKKTFRKKLANVTEWLKRNRHRGGLCELWQAFCRKLQGHIAYFGVTTNSRQVGRFLHQAKRLFIKWMNRRSQRPSLNWQQFKDFEKQHPLPKAKVYHFFYR